MSFCMSSLINNANRKKLKIKVHNLRMNVEKIMVQNQLKKAIEEEFEGKSNKHA